VSFEDIAKIALDSVNDAVLAVNASGFIVYINAVAETLTGCPNGRALSRPVDEVLRIVDEETRCRAPSPTAQAISEGRVVPPGLGRILLLANGGALAIEDSAVPVRNQRAQVVGAVLVFHDARFSRRMVERIDYQAKHDSLTGLANRMLLTDRLNRAVSMAARHHRRIALLFLDIDNFKAVNDHYGHSTGDEMLRNISTAILTCVRATDTVARLGGDEFVILLTEIEQTEDAAQVAENLLHCYPGREMDGEYSRDLTLSIGVSTFPENGPSAVDLMQCADAAMYRAKALGRNNFQFFEKSANREVSS
jgi:diguanylate cyclase (GGDEF)-like protein